MSPGSKPISGRRAGARPSRHARRGQRARRAAALHRGRLRLSDLRGRARTPRRPRSRDPAVPPLPRARRPGDRQRAEHALLSRAAAAAGRPMVIHRRRDPRSDAPADLHPAQPPGPACGARARDRAARAELSLARRPIGDRSFWSARNEARAREHRPAPVPRSDGVPVSGRRPPGRGPRGGSVAVDALLIGPSVHGGEDVYVRTLANHPPST